MTQITSLQANVRGSGMQKAHGSSLVQFAREANVTAYGAGDVVSDNSGEDRAIAFDNCGPSGAVRGAVLTVGDTKTANFELWLFDSEPTNFTDNVALALVAADIPKLLGVLTFADSGKTTVGTNLDVRHSADKDPIPYVTQSGGKLWGLLVTRSAYTPASGALFTVRLRLEHE